jgi:hypothetical protein
LPELADGDVITSANAGYDSDSPREISLGVLWSAPRSVRQIWFRQGLVTEQGSGYFDAPPRLQVTSDGTSWRDAADYTVAPSEYAADARSSLGDFIFTLPANLRMKGVRITGKVGNAETAHSHFPRVRELEVYGTLASPHGAELEYQSGSVTVAAGQPATFSVRPKAMALAVYQWQKSADGGAHWENLPGENASFYRILSARPADGGAIFRCVVANGTSPDAISKPATLTVK